MMVTCSVHEMIWSTTRQAGISGNKRLGKDDFQEVRQRRHMSIRRENTSAQHTKCGRTHVVMAHAATFLGIIRAMTQGRDACVNHAPRHDAYDMPGPLLLP